MIARSSPMVALSPALTRTLRMYPPRNASISVMALSVSTTSIWRPASIKSPSRTSHSTTVFFARRSQTRHDYLVDHVDSCLHGRQVPKSRIKSTMAFCRARPPATSTSHFMPEPMIS